MLAHGRTAGLLLAVVATASCALAIPGGWTARFAFVAGWVAVLAVALLPRDGGGYLVGSDARGYTLLALGLALLLFGIVTVRPLRPDEDEALLD